MAKVEAFQDEKKFCILIVVANSWGYTHLSKLSMSYALNESNLLYINYISIKLL